MQRQSLKNPHLYQVSAFFDLTAAGTRQEALQTPLARSSASRLNYNYKAPSSNNGFVIARLNELLCDNIATNLSSFPAVKLVTRPTDQVMIVHRYLRFFLPIKIAA